MYSLAEKHFAAGCIWFQDAFPHHQKIGIALFWQVELIQNYVWWVEVDKIISLPILKEHSIKREWRTVNVSRNGAGCSVGRNKLTSLI